LLFGRKRGLNCQLHPISMKELFALFANQCLILRPCPYPQKVVPPRSTLSRRNLMSDLFSCPILLPPTLGRFPPDPH